MGGTELSFCSLDAARSDQELLRVPTIASLRQAGPRIKARFRSRNAPGCSADRIRTSINYRKGIVHSDRVVRAPGPPSGALCYGRGQERARPKVPVFANQGTLAPGDRWRGFAI